MKKKHIIRFCIVLGIVLIVCGIAILISKTGSKKMVNVYSVASVNAGSWEDDASSEGVVTNNVSQNIYLEENQTVSEIFVEEGQQVKEGDKIFAYDTEKALLELELKELLVENDKNKLEIANRRLVKLRNTTPVADEPDEVYEPDEVDEPDEPDEPVEEVKPKTGSAYNIVDKDAEPYDGDGKEESPYRYLCTESAYISGELINVLAGYNANGTKKKSDPKAAIFEVHENNKKKGKVIYSLTLNGEKVVDPQIRWSIQGYEIVDTEDEDVDEYVDDSQDDIYEEDDQSSNNQEETYTRVELNKEIAETEQEIKESQVDIKEAEIEYQKAKKLIDDAVVTSSINGIVKKINSSEEAADSSSSEFISIVGSEGLYIKGYLNELMLEEIEIGQRVTAQSWESGTYEAEIKEISQYPSSSSYMNVNGNPNSSYYPYIAYVDNADGLSNGDYVEIKMNKADDAQTSLLIPMALVRNVDGNYYVLAAGEDDRLMKQSITIGLIYSEWGYIEIKSGVTAESRIAFPYGKTAKEGIKVQDAEFEDEYNYE